MMTREKPTYTRAPEPPTDPDLRRRYDEVLAVIADRQTVSAAARTLGMSRNHFQTILHRALEAVIEAITPKQAGRPAKPEREQQLELRIQQLEAELAAVKDREAMLNRVMNVVSAISSGKMSTKTRRARKSKPTSDDDPEPTRKEAVMAMRAADVPVAICARVVGVSPSTVQRDQKAPASTCRSRATRTNHDPETARLVGQAVRDSHGLIGAESLGKRFGLPRRVCAAIKKRENREREIERKSHCARVSISAPGLVRGFDAMHLRCTDGKAYWLVAADAAVPFRTSIVVSPRYDAASVRAALLADFEEHGVPLVLRWDRIACQRTPEIEELLAKFQVLSLHGPPRHPLFYGQLERQNGEHRQFLDALGSIRVAELPDAANTARSILNSQWTRRTLDWCTSEQAWLQRDRPTVDRADFFRDVNTRAQKLIELGVEKLRARRQAIESGLMDRNLLTINYGGDC